MDELVTRVTRQLHRMRDLQDHMERIRVREMAPGGVISLEVDGYGGLISLELGVGITRLSPEEFSTLFLETAARAAGRAYAKCAELIVAFNQDSATR
ncbi:YbaB/EbfC family DNA-binding protein [Nocardia sp. CDC160]|uniref:YbaB/EbfC family DNA-binding protein n=1 Tax=Nocardia sp. CDC160 TaxID=3112166 RepID=UPI002DBC37FF|nr:YbaB/EbfC family DNA-binding protein [Nocardia sp. CDC160]MEC3919264.1 YbaB/EbfC family DNA-binding protein [Nocardia sp. CDC160]